MSTTTTTDALLSAAGFAGKTDMVTGWLAKQPRTDDEIETMRKACDDMFTAACRPTKSTGRKTGRKSTATRYTDHEDCWSFGRCGGNCTAY